MSSVIINKLGYRPLPQEIYEALASSIDEMGGVRAFVTPGDRVVIKPNLTWEVEHETTSRTVIYAVSKYFVDQGCRVVIGENVRASRQTETVIKALRIPELVRRLGIEFVDLGQDLVTVPTPASPVYENVQISRVAMESDALINLPLMKSLPILTHVTMGLKNMKGVLPPEQKIQFHDMGLAEGIALISHVLPPKLTVLDATLPLDWRTDGSYAIRPMGLVLVSDDVLACDVVAASLMGFDPKQIDHFVYAHRLGVGELELDNIRLVGGDIEKLRVNFAQTPTMDELLEELPGVQVVSAGACSSCEVAVATALLAAREQLKVLKDVALLVGADAEPIPGKRHIVAGRCLGQYKDVGCWIPGCPPGMMVQKLVDFTEQTEQFPIYHRKAR